ncbi:MAG: metallopeptidase family protein, partial [Gemmatimonadota bacterium]
MKFAEFEEIARAEWERIPAHFRGGVDGLVIERDALAHPEKRDIYTLGECVTESWPSDYQGPDTTRSSVVLYYGSFRRLATLDPDFDWEAEIWETLTHELRHHLESLADDEALLDVDAAMEEHFARREGESFDPFYYRAGESLGRGVYRLDGLYFVEIEGAGAEAAVFAGEGAAGAGAGPAKQGVTFVWEGNRYDVALPDLDADIVFAEVVEGVEPAPAELHLVLLFPVDRP